MRIFNVKFKHLLNLFAFLFAINFGFSQVTENFDGLTTPNTYAAYSINGFNITNGMCNTTNSRSGSAVRLRNNTTSLEYVGLDGNGKDGGVGDISFWYRSWDASPTAIYNVEISISSGAYTTIGSQININSTTYAQWTHTLNNTSDDIKIRITRVSGERLHIDDFGITNYAAGCTHTISSFTPSSGSVGSSVTITGTGFTGSSTVAFNGTSATVTANTSTTLTVTVPVGATTGVITVTESACDVDSATDYTVTVPTITTSPTSLTGFTYIESAGPSAEQSFDVSGSDLTADITVTPPTNWEIATVSGGPYQTTAITLSESGGTVSTTTIYTRMVSGLLNVNSPFSGNIICASTGATTENVAVDGTVTLSGACSEIFISEYIEGSSNNKFIELYNPTGSTITLTGVYDIQIYSGGSATAGTTIALTGSIAANDVFILENSGESLSVIADQSSGSLSFNGDDDVVLRNSSTIIDVIGQIGTDPGSEWTGTTCTQGTANGTLVRNSAIQEGDNNGADAFDPDTEWTCYVVDDVSNLGSHTSSCAVCSHTISSFTPSSGSIGSSVTITGTGFTGSSTVAFNGTSASVTFVNSTTLTATVPTGATTSVITVTESGCDVDSATDYTVTACTPTQTISSFAPTSGPELTDVTITGTGFTGSSTVTFNGTSATIISQTTTQLVVEVPAGATTGVITVIESSCGLDSSSDFTVLTDNGCTGSPPIGFTDILFSGVYDETAGSCHYIELYNPTTSAIDLSTYSIGSSNNQTTPNDLPGTYNGGTYALSGIIQPQSTFLILATSAAANCASCVNVTLDLEFLSSSLGYNGFTSADYDKLILLNGATPVDLWSNGNGHDNGYIYSRLTTATAPALTFNPADWSDTTTPDCFSFAISSTPLPTIDIQPTDDTSCSAYEFSVTASPGNGGALTYQWRFNDGISSGWPDLTSTSFSPGIVIGETSTSLSISGVNLENYQFYCAVFEDGLCASYTNGVKIDIATTTWNGSSWSNGTPTLTDNAVINGNYSTSANGNCSACQLFLNTGFNLTVGNLTFVEVENDAIINGNLVVETQGAFVQNSDTSNFTLGGTAVVNKSTSTLNNWYDYTYWSSPVTSETIGTVLSIAPADRRFWFNAANYLDVFEETNNNNAAVAGHDDIDDDGDDWQYALAADPMTPGVGYAATVNATGFSAGSYSVSFEGEFNNGVITTSIAYNGANGDLDWNFIGNPYSSAINTSSLFTTNSGVISGAAYLWSQNTAPSTTANGNEGENFATADYAIITSGVNSAGGDGIIPTNFIASGQGFFVQGLTNGTVTFNNAMRMANTSSNTDFFKSSNSKQTPDNEEINAVWVNLTSNNGIFNQIAVAYIDGATDGNDGMSYDAIRNTSSRVAAILYTKIENDNNKFAIQAKAIESLNENDITKLGFKTSINTPTDFKYSIAQIKGEILPTYIVYLKDNLLDVVHNLSLEDYNFTSEVGEFNERFQIQFKENIALNLNDLSKVDELIIENNENNGLNFSTSKHATITAINIFDVLGRALYSNTFNKQETLINVKSEIKQHSVLLINVTLSTGEILTKKLIKN